MLQSMEGSLRTRHQAHLSELALLNLASMNELSSSTVVSDICSSQPVRF